MTNEIDDELLQLENEISDSDQVDEKPPVDIIAFNELRSCADLFRLHDKKQLLIQPDYQREFVWKAADQTRFIDSLVKQLPIPSMCISLDSKTDERQVVDGLQRMSSIIRFLSDNDWSMSKLSDIDPRISGKTVKDIKVSHPEVFSKVENVTIPVTVIRCDLSKRNHQEYLYTIFHRLNTGGTKLTAQEIRNCIYNGNFNRMLKDVVCSSEFSSLFELDDGKKHRFAYEELVLRIFALSKSHQSYKSPLTKFLNDFMHDHRGASDEVLGQMKAQILKVLTIVYEKGLGSKPLPNLSKATTEAIFVGVFQNIDKLNQASHEEVAKKLTTLRKDELFGVQALKEGLAATDKVKARINRAIEIFGTND